MKSDFQYLYNLLEKEHSKKQSVYIAQYVIQNSEALDALFECLYHKNKRVSQRAAWPLLTIIDIDPDILFPYLPLMLKKLGDPQYHDAIARNTLRLFRFIDIPEELAGTLYDKCMTFIIDPKEAVASRAFSIHVVIRIVKMFPELKEEIQVVIEELSNYPQTPGILSSIRHAKKELSKLS